MFNDAPTAPIASRPRRRWRVRLLLVGVPILALVLSGVVWLIRANLGLQAAIDEADRLDPRWRLEEIEADRFTPPPGQNAADKIAAIQRLRPPRPWPHYKKVQLFNDVPPVNQLNDEQIAALKELLEPDGPALAEARSLIDTPSGRHPIVYSPDWIGTLLPLLDGNRMANFHLRLDVFDRVQMGDADGAVRSCHAAFHAGSSIGDEPFMASQNTRIACQMNAIALLERTLAQGEPSDALLGALQARIEAVESTPLLLYSLRGERAGRYQFFGAIRDGTLPTNSAIASLGMGTTAPPELEYLFNAPGFILLQQTSHLRHITALVDIARLPPEQWAEPLATQHTKTAGLSVVVRHLFSPEIRIAQSFQRNHGTLRCAIVAIVAIAAERYRRSKGGWPATPDSLVIAGLLKSVPTDPFAAGQRIKFAPRPDGLTVYSVGENGIDDGGNLTKDVSGIGADLGFRLWDVAARRQPPLPPKPAEGPP
jgi:hypothetical protein